MLQEKFYMVWVGKNSTCTSVDKRRVLRADPAAGSVFQHASLFHHLPNIVHAVKGEARKNLGGAEQKNRGFFIFS